MLGTAEEVGGVFVRTLKHECASVGWRAKTYVYYHCTNTGCRLEDLSRAKSYIYIYRERERERRKYVLSACLDADNLLWFPLMYVIVGCWLVVWVLWHINLCRLFNDKSIFMKIILFRTIQFTMSTQFNCQNISISSYSVYLNSSNSANSV